MIFVDTNVFMYAVGRPHALQTYAQDFFIEANRSGTPLCTSAEVMQELAHVYLPTGRLQTFDATLGLIASAGVEVWPLEEADVALARQLHEQHPTLQARDLCHVASCRRRGVREIKTFDRTLAALSGNPSVQ
ncbi:MAG: type II toxin-antitoxin system VapC family toxin [Dehalococcoidia bacterium]|nr:type II toxin-antitoxin system VapC family toxin [Dehalococcoidia bacterium]